MTSMTVQIRELGILQVQGLAVSKIAQFVGLVNLNGRLIWK